MPLKSPATLRDRTGSRTFAGFTTRCCVYCLNPSNHTRSHTHTHTGCLILLVLLVLRWPVTLPVPDAPVAEIALPSASDMFRKRREKRRNAAKPVAGAGVPDDGGDSNAAALADALRAASLADGAVRVLSVMSVMCLLCTFSLMLVGSVTEFVERGGGRGLASAVRLMLLILGTVVCCLFGPPPPPRTPFFLMRMFCWITITGCHGSDGEGE